MLPRFPNFKKLQLSDREDVQRHTSRHAPFSDFNFTALWSWDTDDTMLLCELNGNLVVRFADFATGDAFYSFLGCDDLDDTVGALLDLSDKENLQPRLQLVPELAAGRLRAKTFVVVEDQDHADYILMVDRLLTYQGPTFASKRNEVRKFLRCSPEARFELLDLDDKRVIEQAEELFWLWLGRRHAAKDCNAERELKAFTRCLKSRAQLPLIGAGIFVGGSLVAISLSEIVEDRHAFTHFEKADTVNFPGIHSFFNQQVATLLSLRGVQYINIEQDLGIPGLRMNKKSYFPCNFLRKFSIDYRSSEPA